MSIIKCPECGEQHDIIEGCNYFTAPGTNKIIIVNGKCVVSENIIDNLIGKSLVPNTGSIMFCSKIERYIALGATTIKAKVDDLSDDMIRF